MRVTGTARGGPSACVERGTSDRSGATTGDSCARVTAWIAAGPRRHAVDGLLRVRVCPEVRQRHAQWMLKPDRARSLLRLYCRRPLSARRMLRWDAHADGG